MKQPTLNPSKPQTTQFKGQRPPLRKRIFSFVKNKKAHDMKRHAGKDTGAVAEDGVEAAPVRPRGSWQDDIEGLVPVTVLESTAQANRVVRREENLRFCATVIGVFLLLFGLVVVVTALGRNGAFSLFGDPSGKPSSTPAAAHTPTTVHRPREAVVSELPEESARGKQVTADEDEATNDGGASIENSETQTLQTQSPKEASANCTDQTALASQLALDNVKGDAGVRQTSSQH
ncbi:hypothetical protein MTO96_038329 [Rhipicephalus appendiculatus]